MAKFYKETITFKLLQNDYKKMFMKKLVAIVCSSKNKKLAMKVVVYYVLYEKKLMD